LKRKNIRTKAIIMSDADDGVQDARPDTAAEELRQRIEGRMEEGQARRAPAG
jgi:hypothetical protein